LKSILLVIGIVIMIFAVGVAVIPRFTTCESQGKLITLANGKTIPMKCSWSGQAELALGIPLFAVGAMMTASRRKENIRNLSILAIVLGAVMLLVPTLLIGVCTTAGMLCNAVMSPALILVSSLVILAGIIGLIVSLKAKEQN
jgi:hypothetical protein